MKRDALGPVIDVRNLNVSFASATGTVKVVEGVSFHIDKGECLAIVGE